MEGAQRESLRQMAERLAERPEYAPLRTYIRGTVSMALGEPRKVLERKEELTDRDCITHSLIADWLDEQGYYIPAQLMRTQMAKDYVEDSGKFLEFKNQNLDFLLKNYLKIQNPPRGLRKKEKPVENGQQFSTKIKNPAEFRREPIKIAPISDAEMREIYRQQMQVQRARLARRNQLVVQTAQVIESDSDDSDSDSDDSTSSSSSPQSEGAKSHDDSTSEDASEKEEKVTFADILKKSLSFEEEDSGGSAPWGPPLNLGLVTDNVAPPTPESLPSIFGSAHLPQLPVPRRASVESADSEDIDALLEGLDDLEDSEDGEKTPRVEDMKKPLNMVKPIARKEEAPKVDAPQVEPLVLSDESIDELEDFDTGALSSAGSDYSF